MKKMFYLLALASVFYEMALAQHQQHDMPGMPKTKKHAADSMKIAGMDMDMPGMKGMGHNMPMDDNIGMGHSYSLNLPMNRNGSGTGWLPDASPMYGYMFHSSKWMYMLHGNLFLRYDTRILPAKDQGAILNLMHPTG